MFGKVVDKFTDRNVTTWSRAEPCWPIKALPIDRDVSVSKTIVPETCHSVLHFEIHCNTLHAITQAVDCLSTSPLKIGTFLLVTICLITHDLPTLL